MALIGAVYFLPDGSSSSGLSKLNQYERMQIHTSECLGTVYSTQYTPIPSPSLLTYSEDSHLKALFRLRQAYLQLLHLPHDFT